MTQSRFADEDTLAHIAQLEAENARQAAVIEQMREALQRCTKFTQEDYDAMALQPCPEVLKEHDQMVIASFLEREGKWTVNDAILNKVRADAVHSYLVFAYGEDGIDEEDRNYMWRIEQGEA